MSVIIDVEAKEGTEEAAPRGTYALVKGSPGALGALLAEGSAPPWYETAYLELSRIVASWRSHFDSWMPMLMLPSCPEGKWRETFDSGVHCVRVPDPSRLRVGHRCTEDCRPCSHHGHGGRAAHDLACSQQQLLCPRRFVVVAKGCWTSSLTHGSVEPP